jgi:WD40 repeat protein
MNISVHPSLPLSLSCSGECVLVWDLDSFKKMKTLASKTIGLSQAEFTNSGKHIITCLKNDLFVWDAFKCQFLFKLIVSHDKIRNHEIDIQTFIISHDDRLLIAGGNGSTIYIWDLQQKQLSRVFDLPYTMLTIRKIRISSDCNVSIHMVYSFHTNQL